MQSLFGKPQDDRKPLPPVGIYAGVLTGLKEVSKAKFENGVKTSETSPAILFTFLIKLPDGKKEEVSRALPAFFSSERATIYEWLSSMSHASFMAALELEWEDRKEAIVKVLEDLTGRLWQVQIVNSPKNKEVRYVGSVFPIPGGQSDKVIGTKTAIAWKEEGPDLSGYSDATDLAFASNSNIDNVIGDDSDSDIPF
jgi:hypothetical protein